MKTQHYLIWMVVLLISACHKDKGTDECTWPMETTAMSAGYCKLPATGTYDGCSTLSAGDSLRFDLLQIGLTFGMQYLPNEVCSTPHDSLVGNISNLWVIAMNDYNNQFRTGDTLNSMINLRSVDAQGVGTGLTGLYPWLGTHPACAPELCLYLAQPPLQAGWQGFRIIYQESDGTIFSLETTRVIITP